MYKQNYYTVLLYSTCKGFVPQTSNKYPQKGISVKYA